MKRTSTDLLTVGVCLVPLVGGIEAVATGDTIFPGGRYQDHAGVSWSESPVIFSLSVAIYFFLGSLTYPAVLRLLRGGRRKLDRPT